jgi:hypothetical protein
MQLVKEYAFVCNHIKHTKYHHLQVLLRMFTIPQLILLSSPPTSLFAAVDDPK